jgi:hypothetical protein
MPQEPQVTASPGYALGQLQRAVDRLASGAGAHGGEADQGRARAKIAQWRAVLAGMADGALSVGSRTPVAGTPAWVTLEVAHGGFATGRYLAEAPLRADERALLDTVPGQAPGVSDRERLNLWFLGDDGQALLRDALSTGAFAADVPEEAALPTVAWLLSHGHDEAALDLVAQLRPWLARLRFTPRLGVPPRPSDALVRVRTVTEVASALRGKQPPRQIAVMRETLQVWHPLKDRLVQLWCDTVDGDLPRLAKAADGTVTVTGGWPCRRWPADWAQRRQAWLADFDDASRDPQSPRRGWFPYNSTVERLHEALLQCEADSRLLTGRNVGRIRRTLANTISRHGAPGSPALAAARAEQARIADLPLHADLATVLASRLERYPADGGIATVDDVVTPVTDAESAAAGAASGLRAGASPVPAGIPLPWSVARKAEQALEAPADELVARGVIGSAEVLADVLPQITAHVVAAPFDDPALRRLYGQGYGAFRRRRSLLLLNLASQVRYAELPWVGAVQPMRAGTSRAARQTLEQVTMLALTGFPQTILPNPLVAEMMALAREAGLRLPLVQEVAADIFMGMFTWKWQAAAIIASTSLHGTLYGRYYGLPGPEAWPARPAGAEVTDGAGDAAGTGPALAAEFAARCAARAKEAQPDPSRARGYVARNGTVIEQSQVLTTHNLAVLVEGLELRDQLAATAPGVAGQALGWAIRALRQLPADRRARLQALKNAAYAWRQGIYFLSLLDPRAQRQAVDRIRDMARSARDGQPERLPDVIDGLAHVIAGGAFDPGGMAPGGGRRFLGWSAGPHWLLDDLGLSGQGVVQGKHHEGFPSSCERQNRTGAWWPPYRYPRAATGSPGPLLARRGPALPPIRSPRRGTAA